MGNVCHNGSGMMMDDGGVDGDSGSSGLKLKIYRKHQAWHLACK